MIKNLIKNNKVLFSSALLFKEFLTRASFSSVESNLQGYYNDLNNTGITVIPDVFNEELCDSLINGIENTPQELVKVYDNDIRIWNFNNHNKECLEKFSLNTEFSSLGEAYSREELVFQTTMAGRVSYKLNSMGSGGSWHRDSFSKQFKAMVYLVDVDEDNGPFQYLEGSHYMKNILKTIFFYNKSDLANYSRLDNDVVTAISNNESLTIKTCAAKKGSVVLFDSRGIHRGMPMKKGVRYALTNYYVAKSYYQKNVNVWDA